MSDTTPRTAEEIIHARKIVDPTNAAIMLEIPAELVQRAMRSYTAYCVAVGGKAFNGDPLPSAEEFFSDPAKTLQAEAWLYAAYDTERDMLNRIVMDLEAQSSTQLDDLLEEVPIAECNEHETLVKEVKEFRRDLDYILQAMKAQTQVLAENHAGISPPEAVSNHVLSIRHLEDAIMRQGMVLKNLGTPNPYPESYNPQSTVVEPTADGLKL